MNFKKVFASTPVLMGILLCFWGSYATISKLILTEIDNHQLNFYIFFFALLIYPLINWKHMRKAEVLPGTEGTAAASTKITSMEIGVILLSCVVYFGYYFTYAYALSFIPAVEASMINYLFPVMIVVFAVLIHHEKITVAKVLAILCGLLGVAVIATNGNLLSFRLSNPVGDLMAFTAAVCWGLFSNLGKWLKRYNARCNYVFIAFAFVFSAIAMFAVSDFVLPSWKTLLMLLCISTTNLSLGISIWFRILKTVPTTLVACMTFITPFVNLLFITVFLHETISPIQAAGAALVVLGIVIQSGVFRRLFETIALQLEKLKQKEN